MAQDGSDPRLAFHREIRAGFGHLLTQPVLRRLCTVSAAAMLAIGFYESIDFAIIAALGQQRSFFGILMSVQAAGSILGGLPVTVFMRRLSETRTVAIGLACFAAASAGLTINALPVVFAAAVVLGAGISFFILGFSTAQQRLTPSRLRGRVSAASYVITDIPQTLSIGIGAALITVVDYRVLLGVLVLVTAGCAISLIFSRPPAEPAPICNLQVTSPNGEAALTGERSADTRRNADPLASAVVMQQGSAGSSAAR